MRNLLLFSVISTIFLSACDSAKTPSKVNFTAAINQYLAKRGQTCTSVARQFPIDVPRSEQNNPSRIGAKMGTLERAGLVHATDTMAVVHGIDRCV